MWSFPPSVTGRFSRRRITVTSVVSRIGTASTSSGSSIVATVVPAVVQLAARPERGEHEAEHLAARVAHEHGRALARSQIEGQEAEAREAERECEHEDDVVLVGRGGVDREVAARDRRERRGEPVHVVEQVEGVGDADEPHDRDDGRDRAVPDQLHAEAGCNGDARRRELGGELGERAQVADVVHQPGDEEDRAAREDAEQLTGRVDRADGERAGRHRRTDRARSRRRRTSVSVRRASARP